MLNVVVLVSGGGTNLQAIIDAVDSGEITNTKIAGVISNNKNAYALERAEKHGIPNQSISPKDYESREIFNQEFMKAVDAMQPDSGRIFGSDSGRDDREIQKPYDQHPSVSDSGILRNRILWIESARKSAGTWGKGGRCNGTFRR